LKVDPEAQLRQGAEGGLRQRQVQPTQGKDIFASLISINGQLKPDNRVCARRMYMNVLLISQSKNQYFF
jgi:hypothetical protein